MFAYPYLVTFDDSMAYGSHHFLTNFKFQCMTREALLFRKIVDDQADWHGELDDVIMLTAEGYSRNLSPVRIGETVVVFMTIEDQTLSSARLCFRAVSNEGKPVACGFQTAVCVDRAGNSVIAPPKALVQFGQRLAEPLTRPNFKERALQGGSLLATVFDSELIGIAKRLGTAPVREAYPQFVSLAQKEGSPWPRASA
ncbi:MAG TPA: acyl-CoA thioesterase [Candidatus Acidoferrales bacterium]|nr:acyl-CoA thioesterase [Candidatus Acidoferrales bacterium]